MTAGRPVGTTGVTVSPLGLGGSAFGQQFGPVTAAEVAATVRAALDAGVTLIDTSAYYGEGASETLLGDALAGVPRDSFVLCTKAGRLGRDRFDFTPAGVRACVAGSLGRLRLDHVDILLAHDIEFADDFDDTLTRLVATLQDLKQAGVCRGVGVSGLPLALLRRVVETCPVDVVMSYCHLTLQDTTLLAGLLPAAAAGGVAVLNASPLAMGLLTAAGPPAWHPAPAAVLAAARRAAAVCADQGIDLATLALQYSYAEGAAAGVAATITGPARCDELRANLDAVRTPPDPAAVAAVRAALADVRDVTWPSGRWVK